MCIFENRLVERGLGGSQAGPLARIHVGHFFARVCPLGGRPVSAFGVFSRSSQRRLELGAYMFCRGGPFLVAV